VEFSAGENFFEGEITALSSAHFMYFIFTLKYEWSSHVNKPGDVAQEG